MSEKPGAVVKSLFCVVFPQQNLFFCKFEYLHVIFDVSKIDLLSVINEMERPERTNNDTAYPGVRYKALRRKVGEQ